MSPRSPAELADAIRSSPRVLAVGARTKPRLSEVAGDVALISTLAMNGIVEYDASEFTFSALAGTPIRDIAAALAERGQYLPFDPLLVDAGATLGGTVAAGLSGPGRFRYGGVRDFILGVRFVDGMGRLLRLGGKVVKNAAGFDVPKFLVGSLGRFGALAELTFKVFPRARALRTVRIPVADAREAAAILVSAANARWELDALDATFPESAIFARIGGPAEAVEMLATEVLARWPQGALLSTDEAEARWASVREFRWAHDDGVLVKVPLTPDRVPAFCAAHGEARIHVSAGGNVAFLSTPTAPELDSPGVTLRGDGPLRAGPQSTPQIATTVKAALDPQNRFPD